MGYQALLFCPDEKTARTVTQVLNELDFTVVACTEPFAAVKKLMAEHFDAVVVDCDNEQNATLLFKSARNTVNNQSSLAVAVVEGQAGVAKAFRIGANLVLTKPINVEQAKGTLRVARGLLRKSEGTKPAAGPANPAAKPAAAQVELTKTAPQRPIPSLVIDRPAASVAPLATAASIPPQKPTSQPRVVASLPVESIESDVDIFEVSDEAASPSIAKPAAQISAPKITSAASVASTAVGSFGANSASAPAPAREPKPGVSTEHKPSTVIATPDSRVENVAIPEITSPVEEAPTPFTFGGNISDDTKSSGGGSKKTLLAVAAVVLIAAVGYAVWMQWVRSGGATTGSAGVAPQPATAAATVPQVTPRVPATSIPSSPSSAAISPVQTSAPDSASTQKATGTAKTITDTRITASAENASAHAGKVSSEAATSKPSPSAPVANKAPATKVDAQPIVIKSGVSTPSAKSATTTDAPAPSLAGIAPADNGPLPNLMGSQSKAPTPVLQTLAVSQGVSQGLLLKRVQPTYPANARQARIEGAVQLMATISRNGDISAVKVLTGEPQLAHAAVDAVKQWKYKPYLLNGSPVEIQTQVTVNFKLPH